VRPAGIAYYLNTTVSIATIAKCITFLLGRTTKKFSYDGAAWRENRADDLSMSDSSARMMVGFPSRIIYTDAV
jgi:hypothetical protein